MKNKKPVKVKLPALLPDQVAYITKLKRSEQRGWKPALKILRATALACRDCNEVLETSPIFIRGLKTKERRNG